MPKYAKPKSKEPTKKRSMTPWLIGAGVFFVLLIVLIVIVNNRGSSSKAEPIALPDMPADWINRDVMGNPDAAVTVQTWEDFLCPACQQWGSRVRSDLINDYIKTGQVKMEFHHFPLPMHAPGSEMGAMAAECAADQNAFWPYHDRLFQEAEQGGQKALQLERLVNYAKDMGLDDKEFLQCMTSQKYRDEVTASVTEATALGLDSTPTVLVNGQAMSPFDYNALKAEIDRLLEAANAGN
jgi:protein-disulfide isomerase